MKKVFLYILLVSFFAIGCSSYGVKIKDKSVYVQDIEWATIETITWGNKYSLSTLAGIEFMVFSYEKIGKGTFNNSTGKENQVSYILVKFLNADMDSFEFNGTRKKLISFLEKEQVILDGIFNLTNAIKFKEKYEEDISSQYRGKVIIIK